MELDKKQHLPSSSSNCLDVNEGEQRVAEEYLSSLSDLNCNSKPLINMLTMLAEENIEFAHVIVKIVGQYIAKVPADFKLPILYLIDSIVKNVKGTYVHLFSQCIVNVFCGVFEQVNEKIRERMYALRQTWNEVFTAQKLYALDIKVKQLDQNWPITAKPPSIHVNPNFLSKVNANHQSIPTEVEEILQHKTRELLELKKRKLELELEATKKHLEEQEKHLCKATEGPTSLMDQVGRSTLTSQLGIPLTDVDNRGVGINNLMDFYLAFQQANNTIPISAISGSKVKVHPVNTSLLNVLSSRDPRLARVQEKQVASVHKPAISVSNEIVCTTTDNNAGNSKALASRSSSSDRTEQIASSRHSSRTSNENLQLIGRDRRRGDQSSSPLSINQLPSHTTNSERRKCSRRSSHNKSRQEYTHGGIANKPRSRSPSPSALSKGMQHHSAASSSSAYEKPSKLSSSFTAWNNGNDRKIAFEAMRSSDRGGDDNSELIITAINNSEQECVRSDTDLSKTCDNDVTNTVRDIEMIKKRASTSPENRADEPLPKKCKSGNPQTLLDEEKNGVQHNSNSETILEETKIGESERLQQEAGGTKSEILNDDSWDTVKAANITKSSSLLRKSELEDVHAKVVKTSRFSRQLNNQDKPTQRVLIHQTQLNELETMNDDDTQHSEEKIRTMIAQAQEMLETKTITQEQYRNLLGTVMSINEANKLKQAKRRESLLAIKKRITEGNDLLSSARQQPQTEAERIAAREAILKKRIPKISRDQLSDRLDNFEHQASIGHPGKELKDGDISTSTGALNTHSPLRENDEVPSNVRNVPNISKRGNKVSKWGDRAPSDQSQAVTGAIIGGLIMPLGSNQQRPWNGMHFASHHKRNFRPNGPSFPTPMIPPISNAQQLQWQMTQNNASNCMHPVFPNASLQIPMARNHSNSMLPVTPVPNVKTQTNVPKPSNSIDNPQEDLVRTITIDGITKEILFYDVVAVVFMDADQPREIGFQNGQRKIYIDNQEPIELKFNEDYKTVVIDGETLRLRFGFPSRELYIDEHWYEIYFGGPPITVPIRNKMHILKAEGPPPQVNIGPLRRDLVAGKINMIVDAHTVIPLYLDGRIQNFTLNGVSHTLQFADRLLTVLLDGDAVSVEYGGLPKSMILNGSKYFVRFGALPNGVVAGKVLIRNMPYVETQPPIEVENITCPNTVSNHNIHYSPAKENESAEESQAKATANKLINDTYDSLKQFPASDATVATIPGVTSVTQPLSSTGSNVNIDELFQKLVSSGILGTSKVSSGSTLPVLAMSTPPTPIVIQENSIDVDQNSQSEDANIAIDGTTTDDDCLLLEHETCESHDELTKKEKSNKSDEDLDEKSTNENIYNDATSEEDELDETELINTLFSGMQCSSCGIRFPPEETIQYSQHLDWHFRKNRRDRDSTRTAHSRKWYYALNDWVQYEEIGDIDDREKNFFELQQNIDQENADEIISQRQQISSSMPTPTCPANADDVDRGCDMCHEKFEHFYNEELEEWHLRGALRVNDKIYHPLCFDDHKASLLSAKSDLLAEDDNAVDLSVISKDDDENQMDNELNNTITGIKKNSNEDDDDDVIMLPNEEPLITEIVDDDDDVDDEYIPTNVTHEEMGNVATATQDSSHVESDVEIQEPDIPFTDLDYYNEQDEFVTKEKPKLDSMRVEKVDDIEFKNIKIKREPKDELEDDEDDGFEDVGTVLITPEELTVGSIDTQQRTTPEGDVAVSTPPISALNREEAATSVNTVGVPTGEAGVEASFHTTSLDTGMIPTDDYLEQPGISLSCDQPQQHNLSIVDNMPTVPLTNLVNKIKINISKSSVSAISGGNNSEQGNSNMSATVTQNSMDTETAITHTIVSNIPLTSVVSNTPGCLSTTNSNAFHVSEFQTVRQQHQNGSLVNSKALLDTPTAGPSSISTIPVLCSGGITTRSTIATCSFEDKDNSKENTLTSKGVLSLSASTLTKTTSATVLEEQIEINCDLKPSLQNVILQKRDKVVSGNETSGLCSIM